MHEGDNAGEPPDDLVLPGMPGSAAPANDESNSDTSASTLRLSAARRILSGRRLRAQMFDPEIFGEPAWDMLLTLYVQEAARSPQTRASLAQAVGAPPSVAVRWQDYLERRGLVELTHGSGSGPLILRITPHGREVLDRYLAQVGGGDTR
jgi:DNA-binding MarR family transcriptional regulator